MSQKCTTGTQAPAKADAGTFRELDMEDSILVHRVTRELYAKPESGLRELLANEITTARKARSLGANPTIEVTVKPDMVRIQGIDSLGITRETFEEIYLCLGRSGNSDRGTPGQFGLGRGAYVTLSDEILIETNPRGEKSWSAVGLGGRGYQTGLTPPDMPLGTRVTLVPRRRDIGGLLETAKLMAGMSDIPIVVIEADGSHLIPPRELFRGNIAHARRDDVEFGLAPGRAGEAYLCGVPIAFEYRGCYGGLGAALNLNILDEGRYMPTPDRERMSEAAEIEISTLIDAEFTKWLRGMPTDLAGLLGRRDGRFALKYSGGRFPAYTRRIKVYGVSGKSSLEYTRGEPILNCKSFDAAAIRGVLEEYHMAEFVQGVPELEPLESFMERQGIRRAKMPSRPRAKLSGVPIHTSTGVIRVPDGLAGIPVYTAETMEEIRAAKPLMEKNGFALTLHRYTGATPLKDALAEARSKVWRTSRGDMTGAELEASTASVYRTENPALVDLWGDNGVPTVLETYGRAGTVLPRTSIIALDRGSPQWCMLVRSGGVVQGSPLEKGSGLSGWTTEAAMEAYLRLETPVYRKAVAQSTEQDPDLCDELLALEGKEPVVHRDGCWCVRCAV